MDREKAFKRKRLWSFAVCLSYTFFGGCELVAILPTLWQYLQSFGVTDESWMGFMVSVYSTAGAISGVVGGRLSDKFCHHTKAMVLTALLLRATGNFLYLCAVSVPCIILARCLSGLGTAAAIMLAAEICRTTRKEERTKFLSLSSGMFQLGIIVGPALQLIMSSFDFDLFGLIRVTPVNAPGLFLGLLWLVLGIMVLLMFQNLTEEFRDIETEREEVARIENGTQIEIDGEESEGAPLPEDDAPLIESQNLSGFRLYLNEFLTDSYVTLLSLVFIGYFGQIGIETVLPIITDKNFGYGVRENSLVYMMCAMVALAVYVVVPCLSKIVRDTTLLVSGVGLAILAQMWLIYTLAFQHEGSTGNFASFLFGLVTIYLGFPIASIANATLSSKVLSSKTQGMGQGVRRLFSSLGLILGSAWAGSTVRISLLFLGVPFGILIFNGLMMLFTLKKLRAAEEAAKHD